MIENSVVSWSPFWVAVEVKAPPTLPCSAPFIQRPPVWSRKFTPLRRRAAKARAGADDDGVVIGQVLDLPDGSKLVEPVLRRFCNIWRYQFWDALDIDGGTRFGRTFGDGIRHGFGTAIGGIIENENFCHDGFLMFVG
jgi:hypothetical protein